MVADGTSNDGNLSNGTVLADGQATSVDRNVIKTGNMTLPAVSSYYNARMTIEKYLLESRFSKEISFTVGQKGLLLKKKILILQLLMAKTQGIVEWGLQKKFLMNC